PAPAPPTQMSDRQMSASPESFPADRAVPIDDPPPSPSAKSSGGGSIQTPLPRSPQPPAESARDSAPPDHARSKPEPASIPQPLPRTHKSHSIRGCATQTIAAARGEGSEDETASRPCSHQY